MTEQTLLEAATQTRPDNVPEKFWDNSNNNIRVDALLKSYQELERKMGKMVSPDDNDRIRQIMGVPSAPNDYAIDCAHGMFTASPDINAKLHAAGFSQPQAQLLYDLAAEQMVPMIMEVANQYEAERELARLEEQFGGAERWQEISRQIQAFAKANLPPEAARGLATTYDGVMALYRMMEDQIGQGSTASAKVSDNAPAQGQDLQAMLRDPRYWKQKDPSYVAKVTAAFEKKYGG